MKNKKIPLVDLRRQYQLLKDEIDQKIRKILKKGNYILGEEVEEFEKEFADFCNRKYGVSVGSGTDALTLTLRALEIGKGDEVITVSNTFVATVDAIARNQAKPVFVDIDEKDFNIDSRKIEPRITKKTKAIIVVHLYGQPANLDEISQIAKKYKLFLIEDASQAHGAEYKSEKIGSFGVASCFSFYPAKNLGAYGDGGIVLTDNKKLAERIKLLRNYGQKDKYIHKFVGFNSRLDEIQAGILRIKLEYLSSFIKKRRNIASLYNKLLRNIEQIVLPVELPHRKHAYHLYVIRTPFRNKLKDYLESKGIITGIHYPYPVHLQEAYNFLNYKKGSLPITEKISKEIISLPLFPEIKREEIIYVAETIKHFFD